MIKLLVVEDESATRKGLLKHINWSSMGIGQIEEATDGVEGLDIAGRLKPDIIISDIRMPKMDGITFTTHIRQQFPKCQIIFLSGYSDKEYLMAAINLGAVSYVEKPINLNEIKTVIEKTVGLITKKEEENLKQKKISAAFSNSLHLIKQNTVLKLIGKDADFDEILSDLNLEGVSFETSNKFTVSIIVPSYSSKTSDESKLDICNEIIDYLEKPSNDFVHIAAAKDFDHIITISMHRQGIKGRILISVFKSLKHYISEAKPFCCSISWIAGKTVSGLSQVKHSYDTAHSSLSNVFFGGFGIIYFFSGSAKTHYNIEQQVLIDFAALLETPSEDELRAYIEDFCNNLKSNPLTPVIEIKNMFFQMASVIDLKMKQKGLNDSNYAYLGEKHLWSIISKAKTLQELKKFLLQNINLYIYGLRSKGTKSQAIVSAIDYIEEYYGKISLSVKELASYVYLTPTYLSALFKKETGKTIREYITEVRIARSLKYLSDYRLRLYEIAKKTGYSDANYYSKAFKKIKGMTPTEFREKYKP